MENLDDFMKKKMLDGAPDGEQRFEFKEEYWQQAEALIVADERRKRRRRFFWWLSSGALVLALTLGWCWRQSEGPALSTHPSGPNAAENALTQGLSGSDHPAVTTVPSASTDSILAQQNPPIETSAKGSSPYQPQTDASVTATPHLSNASTNPGQGRTSRPNAAHQTSAARPETSQRDAGAARSAARALNPALPGTQAKPATDIRPNAPGRPAASASDTSLAATPGEPMPDNEKQESPVPQIRLEELAFLPTFLRPLTFLTPRLPQKPLPNLPVASTEKPPVQRRLSVGISAFGTGYFPSSASQAFGYGAGLTAEWRIGSAWAIEITPQWRARNLLTVLDSWEPTDATQLRYSFGFERDEYTLDGRASHWLEIPVGVQWRRGPWRAEMGVAPGFLLGVQGRMTHTHESSLISRSTTRKSVRLDKTPFYNHYIPVFAGAHYNITKRLGVGVRMYYLGGDFLRPTDLDSPARQTLWGDAGLRWNLF